MSLNMAPPTDIISGTFMGKVRVYCEKSAEPIKVGFLF